MIMAKLKSTIKIELNNIWYWFLPSSLNQSYLLLFLPKAFNILSCTAFYPVYNPWHIKNFLTLPKLISITPP
jgi:hypothetical protein